MRHARLRLHLKRSHVAHRVAGFTALVGRQRLAVRIDAVHCWNHVDGNAARAKRVRFGQSTVVGKLSQLQVADADVDLVGTLVEASCVAATAIRTWEGTAQRGNHHDSQLNGW